MDIEKYTGNIKPLSKADFVTSIRTEKAFINGIEITFEGLTANNINLDKLVSEWMITKSIIKDLHRTQPNSSTLMEIIRHNLGVASKCLDVVTDRADKIKTKLFTKDTITIYEANILNLVENISFWSKFTNIVLDTLVTMELGDKAAEKVIDKADLNFVNKTFAYYADINRILCKGVMSIFKDIDETVDIEASAENVDALMGTKGTKAVNGFANQFAPHHLNPLYWIANLKADYDLYRLKSLEEDNNMMAMKIAQINNKRNGTNDPELDYRIEVYQDKIIKNKGKQDSIRERYS